MLLSKIRINNLNRRGVGETLWLPSCLATRREKKRQLLRTPRVGRHPPHHPILKTEGGQRDKSLFHLTTRFLKSEPEASESERQCEALEEGERLTWYYHYVFLSYWLSNFLTLHFIFAYFVFVGLFSGFNHWF